MSADLIEAGIRLRSIEKALKLNGAQISRLTRNKIRQSRWTEYCAGERLITVDAALALRDLTGFTLDYIYAGDLASLSQDLRDKLATVSK
jgi:hypothetical protein